MAFLAVQVLRWADALASYVMWIMQTYLTNVWQLGFVHAAGIMNIANGLSKVLSFLFYCFGDAAGLGRRWMLLLSSFSFAIGLGLLSLSTPPVLAQASGTCKMYEPQCVSRIQKTLFYTALAFIAVAIGGHTVSFAVVFVDHSTNEPIAKEKGTLKSISHPVTEALDTEDFRQEVPSQSERAQILVESIQKTNVNDISLPDYRFPPLPPLPDPVNNYPKTNISQLRIVMERLALRLAEKKKPEVRTKTSYRSCLFIYTPLIAVYSLPYIKPWSLRFGIPAICSLVATLAFLRGFHGYKEEKRSKGGPVTNILKVTFSACVNMFNKRPSSSPELYVDVESDDQKLPPTARLRFLDKAANEVGSRKSCTVTEVEETKIIFHMLPIWTSLIFCGIVTSLGSTYFLEQANHMDYKLGKLKLPDSFLLLLHGSIKMSPALNRWISKNKSPWRKGMALATVTAASCCIVAALVESKRRGVIRDHGLIDKPYDKIPMTVFWMFPQYLLLGYMDSLYENCASLFLADQSPPSMRRYLVFLSPVLSGIGIMGSVLSVALVGRISARYGENWFQHGLNASRLDRYYWTLAGLSALNFLWFHLSSCIYPNRHTAENTIDRDTVSTILDTII